MKSRIAHLLALASPGIAAASAVANGQHILSSGHAPFTCDLPPAVAPYGDGLSSADELFSGPEALSLQVQRHSAMVRVPSISYDDLGEVDEDPRWLVFHELHRLLEELFPAVHAKMSLVKVNRFGLVYTLEGSDPSLKRLMLAAHQDVVPVADASTWTYPPFSGHFDGRWLWGRGASDDKNSLTALMSVMETLLSNEAWVSRRGIVLAFGFDEECSGRRGAGTIASYLEERFGRNSMALILDEGGMGLSVGGNNTLYALPAVMEKGHVDVMYELHVQGGHSSMPFPHTGIGIIAEIVSTLEAHPYSPKLISGSPVHNHLVCRARYSPADDPELTHLVAKGDLAAIAKRLATSDLPTNFRLQTSQSVDLIAGGVKINAMPELITLGVNYRVSPHNSIDEIKKTTVKLIQPIVSKYGLSLKAFEDTVLKPVADSPDSLLDPGYPKLVHPLYEVDYNGTLVLTTQQATPVAPVSPTTGPVWDLFSGTIQHTFAFENGTVVPVGEIMTGNTDTRHYLDLTPNIYRWVPVRDGYRKNMHTIDERVDMYAHLEVAKFYYNLIRNFDASIA